MIIKRQLVGHWWFDVALVLTLVAVVSNTITFAGDDPLPEVVIAIGCAGVALLAIAVGWTRMTGLGRGVAALLVLVNAWTLVDTLGRRLPGIMGW